MVSKSDNYISLQEATRYCSYSQEYLSLRARQGKLKAVKLGRNWATKKEWLEKYLAKVEKYKRSITAKKKKPPAFLKKVGGKPNQLFLKEKSKPALVTTLKAAAKKEAPPPENLPIAEEPFEPIKIREVAESRQETMICFPKLRPLICCHFGLVIAIVFLLLIGGGFWQRDFFPTVYQDISLVLEKIDWIGEIFFTRGSRGRATLSLQLSPDIFKDTLKVFGEYGQWLLSTIQNQISRLR